MLLDIILSLQSSQAGWPWSVTIMFTIITMTTFPLYFILFLPMILFFQSAALAICETCFISILVFTNCILLILVFTNYILLMVFINNLNFNLTNSAALVISETCFTCLILVFINNLDFNSINSNNSAAVAICDWGRTASELCPMQLSGLFQHFFAKSLFQHF